MSESGSCEELPYRAFLYIHDLLDSPPDGRSRSDVIEYVRKRYPYAEIRRDYIRQLKNYLKGEALEKELRAAPNIPELN